MSDLVRRLRASIAHGATEGNSEERAVCERQMNEAAGAIERLEQEVERLQTRLDEAERELAARIERLRAELAETKQLASYQTAVEWRDRCKAAWAAKEET